MYQKLIGFTVVLIFLLIANNIISEQSVKRLRAAIPEAKPVIYNGVKYTAPHAKMGYVEAWNEKTGKKLWEKQVYEIKLIEGREKDVQWVFITDLYIENGKLVVINEKKEKFYLDIGNIGKEDIQALIQQLGSTDKQAQDSAQKQLIGTGKTALTPLEKSLEETKDAQLKTRINQIIDAIIAGELTDKVDAKNYRYPQSGDKPFFAVSADKKEEGRHLLNPLAQKYMQKYGQSYQIFLVSQITNRLPNIGILAFKIGTSPSLFRVNEHNLAVILIDIEKIKITNKETALELTNLCAQLLDDSIKLGEGMSRVIKNANDIPDYGGSITVDGKTWTYKTLSKDKEKEIVPPSIETLKTDYKTQLFFWEYLGGSIIKYMGYFPIDGSSIEFKKEEIARDIGNCNYLE
jgi:hypothetical protein